MFLDYQNKHCNELCFIVLFERNTCTEQVYTEPAERAEVLRLA